MEMRRLAPEITVSPQIEPSDLELLAEAGVKTVIDNRPDGEISADLSSTEMASAAAKAGLKFYYLPITPGQFTEHQISEFAKVVEQAYGPVHAYCRSGTRSATAWALSQAGRRPAADILQAAAQAGYDLSNISHLLD